jgi:hypothetical protein
MPPPYFLEVAVATFLTLYTQILDELERPELVSQAKTAIQAAVQQYKSTPFWFTESFFTFYTVRGQEYYGATDNAALATSPEIKKITGLFFNFRTPLTKREWDYIDNISSIPTSYAMPEDWSYAAEQVRLYPIPDKGTSQVAANGYPMTVLYTPTLSTLSNDSDSNAWTNEGYDLIRCRAKVILLTGPMREQSMEGDVVTTMAEEKTFLTALYKENSGRNSTGHSWVTQF